MNSKALSMIGLAAKAGRVSSGETAVENAIKAYNAYLVIVACDASDNTKKKFDDMCKFRDIQIVHFASKEELGKVLGKEYRASIAITDENFAKGIKEKIFDN